MSCPAWLHLFTYFFYLISEMSSHHIVQDGPMLLVSFNPPGSYPVDTHCRKEFRGSRRGRLVGSGLFLLSVLALWAELFQLWEDHSYCQVPLHRDRQDSLGPVLLLAATLKTSHPSVCPLEPSGLQEAFSIPSYCL